jgi:hypothetical protein
MSQADHANTTSPPPSARPAPTFSPSVHIEHTALIARLVPLKPHQIRYCADRRDLEERAEHIEQVLSAMLDYVGVIVRDTAHVAPGGSIDQEYLLGLISNVASDVAGFIANAADQVGRD